LIGYNSTEAPTDGKFHEIKVRVNRRGVDVRARKGYWAYTAEDAARATAPAKPAVATEISEALSTLAEPPKGRPARFWLGTAPGENGRTKVTFAWEPIPAVPGESRHGENAPARVALTAVSPDGRPLFRGRVPQEDAAGGPPSTGATTTPGTPAGSQVSFDAPPGQVQVRMTVEGQSGQVIDSATRELTLPDFSKVEVSFSTPEVFRARTPRDVQTVRKATGAIPTADRIFGRTERLFIRTQAYTPGNATPEFTAKLLNRNGDPMSDVPFVNPEPSRLELEFALSNLAPGDYLIQLQAKTPSGTAQEYVAFRVTR
jgi:hypothetical protein